jgi:hypothetical protein
MYLRVFKSGSKPSHNIDCLGIESYAAIFRKQVTFPCKFKWFIIELGSYVSDA